MKIPSHLGYHHQQANEKEPDIVQRILLQYTCQGRIGKGNDVRGPRRVDAPKNRGSTKH